MKKTIVILLAAVLSVSLAACSQPDNNVNSNSASHTQISSSDTLSSDTLSETSDNTSDYEWAEFKVSGQPLYFAVPADLEPSKGWVINAYLKRDEKMVAVIANSASKTSDLDEAKKNLLTSYFSDATQFNGGCYDQEEVPAIVEKLTGEKKTVNGMETYYFDTKIGSDSDLTFIGYTFIINEIPCAIIAMDLDNNAAKDAAWKEATEKELRERVEYMINHVELRE